MNKYTIKLVRRRSNTTQWIILEGVHSNIGRHDATLKAMDMIDPAYRGEFIVFEVRRTS